MLLWLCVDFVPIVRHYLSFIQFSRLLSCLFTVQSHSDTRITQFDDCFQCSLPYIQFCKKSFFDLIFWMFSTLIKLFITYFQLIFCDFSIFSFKFYFFFVFVLFVHHVSIATVLQSLILILFWSDYRNKTSLKSLWIWCVETFSIIEVFINLILSKWMFHMQICRRYHNGILHNKTIDKWQCNTAI